MGVRQGGFQGDVPRTDPTNTTLQPRLKIALVSDPIFFDFGSILGAKMTPKIHENPFKIVFEIALHFY